MEQTPNTSPTPTSDEKTLAMLSHLLCIFVGFLAPLVIYLIKKDESKFVADAAKEALNFMITAFLAGIVAAFSMLLLIGFLLLPVLSVYVLVMLIIATIETNKGHQYRYPITIRFIS